MKKFISIVCCLAVFFFTCSFMGQEAMAANEQNVKDGLYTLKNVSSGYMLNVYAGKDANGTKVTTWEYDGTTDQRIYIAHQGSGKYLLKFNASSVGRVIDVNRGESLSASIDDGDKIDLWTADDLDAQYFYINPCGDGSYTFELVSKPGHVLSATSASAAASNGTQLQLKYNSGAAYQKWYICNTSGSKINVCNHLHKSNITTSTSYEQINNSQHKMITNYNVVCNDCGEVINNNQTETKTMAHTLTENKCTHCGYQAAKECLHTKTYEEITMSNIGSKDDTIHNVTDIYNIYCIDCKKLIKRDATRSYDEPHTIKNDECERCPYVVPGSEAAKCKHLNTAKHSSDDMKTTVSIKDDNKHTIASYYHVWCADCHTYIKENELDLMDENHTFVNNICSVCNLEKIVDKPAATTLKVAKSSYTPGEAISLSWDSAARATTYDIHINKTGQSSRYRLDAAFTGTSCSIKIDEEGEYLLTVYSVNSGGFTPGGSVTVTVKKPISKGKTANDGLYNIKNVASGYMMNVYAGKDANGTKVTTWENDYSNDQKIYISYQGDGKYLLKYNASANGKVIDVNRGSSIYASIDDGDKIDIWPANDPEAQLFYINDCGGGKFTLELASKPGYVISPANASAANKNGAQLELKQDINADYQKWYIVAPETNQNNNTTSYTALKNRYQEILNNVGWQTKRSYSKWDYMCGCYATAYAHTYLSGNIHMPSEYWRNENDATTHWFRANGTSSYKSTNGQVLLTVKNSIDSGKPCIIKVASKNYGQHYILVIAYSGNGTSQSNFTVVDPYDGKFKSLSNYTIHENSKQVITF